MLQSLSDSWGNLLRDVFIAPSALKMDFDHTEYPIVVKIPQIGE